MVLSIMAFVEPAPEIGPAAAVPLLLLAAVVELALAACVLYVLFFLLTLPMRRRERARIFLDLLELGLREGRTPEKAIVEASASRDPAAGARFHLLAAH